MSFTHYPKNYENLLMGWVWPKPPFTPREYKLSPKVTKTEPNWNRLEEELKPGQTLVFCHDARNFTRFFGSLACDVPLRVTLEFSNDECTPEGKHPTDADLPHLHYDAQAAVILHDPAKPSASSKFFATIYGNWIRVTIEHIGSTRLTSEAPDYKRPAKELRFYLRGSVF